MDDARFMELAFHQATLAVGSGQTPFGAVVVDRAGAVIGEGHNRVRADLDPTAHGEIVAIREAWRRVGAWPLLAGTTLYTSCEPCLLCSFVITQIGLGRVVFAARATDVPGYRSLLDADLTGVAAWLAGRPGWGSLTVVGDFMRERALETIRAFPWADARARARQSPGAPQPSAPFELRKLGHVVIRASDLSRSVEFYTGALGLRVSDVYGEDMMPGGMVFMRCNPDHHGVALVGGMPGPSEKRELHHFAFEVATVDEVFRARAHLRERGVPIVFEGRRRAGVQIAVEFLDPDGHHVEIYWGVDQVAADGQVRPPSEWRQALTLEDAIAHPVPGQRIVLRDPSLPGQR